MYSRPLTILMAILPKTCSGTCPYLSKDPPENEPPHDKTNKMACAPSEDSDQPGQTPILIRVFAVRMKKAWVLGYPRRRF